MTVLQSIYLCFSGMAWLASLSGTGPLKISFDGRSGAALFVAALFLIAFVIIRYWKGVKSSRPRFKWWLTALRASALLLIAACLGGLSVSYEKRLQGKVLVSGPSGNVANERESGALRQVVASIEAHGLAAEVRDLEEMSGTDTAHDSEMYLASVLVSDGAISLDDAQKRVQLVHSAGEGAPVYVAFAQPHRSEPSVSLGQVLVTGSAVRGVPVGITCIVHGVNAKGSETLLTVSDAAMVQASTMIRWSSDDERQVVTLDVVPKLTGFVKYTVRLEGRGGEPAESLTRDVEAYVSERRYKILIFEGQPTWETRFVRRALDQAGIIDADYFGLVSRGAITGQEAIAPGAEPGAKQQNETPVNPTARLHALLANPAELDSYDCIIIGSTPNELISANEAQHLHDWVERRGGGLILLGGNAFSGSVVATGGRLAGLMPAGVRITSAANIGTEQAKGQPVEAITPGDLASITLTGRGMATPLRGFQNGVDVATKKQITIPKEGLELTEPRAGASVLARFSAQGGQGGQKPADRPAVVSMQYGRGTVIAFAPSASWRMKIGEDSNADSQRGPFESLWQGLVLFAASGATSPAELELSDATPVAGEATTLTLRMSDKNFAPLDIEEVRAYMQRTDGTPDQRAPETILLEPGKGEEGVWRGRLIAREKGEYLVNAEYSAGGKTGTVSLNFAASDSTTQEAGAARDTLSRLARGTGGALVSVEDISGVLKTLKSNDGSARSVLRTWGLRTWWILVFIIPLILAAEWLLQRLTEGDA
jgi:hypothetical protein